MKEKTYLYICEDKNCKMFATYGNFKTGWNHPSSVFPMKSEDENKRSTGHPLHLAVMSPTYLQSDFLEYFQ